MIASPIGRMLPGSLAERHETHQRPGRDCTGARGEHALFDDLIRTSQQRRRDRQPERLGGLEVDDQLELRGLLHREIGRFRALENLVYIGHTPYAEERIALQPRISYSIVTTLILPPWEGRKP